MARNTVRMEVDTRRAEAKLRGLLRDADKEAGLTMNELGEVGKQHARLLAPYWSGKTFRNIKLIKGKNAHESTVIAQNPTANDGHIRKIANFNLVKWMHTTKKGQAHIRSGDPRFMYTTRDYLKEIAPVRAQKRFDKIALKYSR